MIHIIQEPRGKPETRVSVWSDCEADSLCDGRIIGQGPTERGALLDARRELSEEILQVNRLLGGFSPDEQVHGQAAA